MKDSLQSIHHLDQLASKAIGFLDLNRDSKFQSEKTNTKIRAKILPKQLRSSYVFAPEIIPWLAANAVGMAEGGISSKTFTYKMALLGITNRPLPGYKKAGLNLFKTFVKVSIKEKWNNLDQCTVEFGQRLPLSATDFIEELSQQIYASAGRIKTKGRLILYCHTSCSTTLTTDLEALRLSIIKTLPVINIDWIDPSASWDDFWNPCSSLEPIKSKLERRLIEFLNQIIENVCASQCNAVIRKSNCFFDDVYLSYRKKKHLPELNKITYLPNTDIQNNRILEIFKAEKNLIGYIDQKFKKSSLCTKAFLTEANIEAGWLPANL